MIRLLRRKLIDTLITVLERALYRTPIRRVLDDDRKQRLFATLWEIPDFREYCIERETRMTHALAQEDDPKYRGQMKGQRMENALWFDRAHKAFETQQRALGKGATGSSSKRSA